jgi:hypothetical protein
MQEPRRLVRNPLAGKFRTRNGVVYPKHFCRFIARVRRLATQKGAGADENETWACSRHRRFGFRRASVSGEFHSRRRDVR